MRCIDCSKIFETALASPLPKEKCMQQIIWHCRMGLSLHQHGHSHGGHDHGVNNDVENVLDDDLKGEKKNINVRAAFIHVLGDFIQSVGVFIAALIIYFKVSNFH